MDDVIFGRNSVLELLKSDNTVDKIYIQSGLKDGSIKLIKAKAAERSIPIAETDKRRLDLLTENGVHQGVAAQMPAVEYVTVEDILAFAVQKGEKPFIVICDSLSDPHNLGSVIRSAECAGAHGLIIPKRHSVSLTSAVAKSSAGAVMHLPIARVVNLAATVELLKNNNVWIYALEADGQPYLDAKLGDSGVAFIMGSEGEGVSELLKKKSDFVLSIPLYGKINSLNVSAAAAVILFEAAKQRHCGSDK